MAQYDLRFDGEKAAAVDEYLEYRRIVGDDDGGELFSPEDYAKYKKHVLPMRLKNRLYTAWTNATGMDCKLIGPETPCFCNHRYKQHKTDFETVPTERPILLPCKVSGCKCSSYHYVPLMSGRAIRCSCKHLAEEHSEARPYQCNKCLAKGVDWLLVRCFSNHDRSAEGPPTSHTIPLPTTPLTCLRCSNGHCCPTHFLNFKTICQKCAGFRSSYACGCGETYNDHCMVVETMEEREARGHPVGRDDVPYQAMGGLTGFSSLAEGYQRLDPSGQGAPSDLFLRQEITSDDHTFLRAAVPTIQAQRRANKDYDAIDEDLAERMSSMKKPGEDDMAYFERRYQEKQTRAKSGRRPIEVDPECRPRTGTRKAPKSGRR